MCVIFFTIKLKYSSSVYIIHQYYNKVNGVQQNTVKDETKRTISAIKQPQNVQSFCFAGDFDLLTSQSLKKSRRNVHRLFTFATFDF